MRWRLVCMRQLHVAKTGNEIPRACVRARACVCVRLALFGNVYIRVTSNGNKDRLPRYLCAKSLQGSPKLVTLITATLSDRHYVLMFCLRTLSVHHGTLHRMGKLLSFIPRKDNALISALHIPLCISFENNYFSR
jgi:hypothetical protein